MVLLTETFILPFRPYWRLPKKVSSLFSQGLARAGMAFVTELARFSSLLHYRLHLIVLAELI